MAIKWNDPEVRERLIAALIGAMGGTVNCREVARLFGGEATYNAVECALRKPKKLAKQLLDDAVDKKSPAASPARPPRTPKKEKIDPLTNGVKSGRVTKKKANGSPIKKEIRQDENNIMLTSGAEADSEGEGDQSLV
ncbi:hypothetical protein BDV96DRAFT_606421 [Lophiotrema nucula]|uniref:Uncharacterized protein n=1 Tax=Lophiotrema nucula TaxID=690887 RepID=A0A6A5YKV7_9PLEO|nr:hypothetical protein BDV96DRAFT_606421 [Lophiotrema nucula]